MPKLYGAPAYARPPMAAVNPSERPFDPDELPIEAERSPEEKELLRQVVARPHDAVGVADHDGAATTDAHGRHFRLRLPRR